jgi:hypothetical protein
MAERRARFRVMGRTPRLTRLDEAADPEFVIDAANRTWGGSAIGLPLFWCAERELDDNKFSEFRMDFVLNVD